MDASQSESPEAWLGLPKRNQPRGVPHKEIKETNKASKQASKHSWGSLKDVRLHVCVVKNPFHQTPMLSLQEVDRVDYPVPNQNSDRLSNSLAPWLSSIAPLSLSAIDSIHLAPFSRLLSRQDRISRYPSFFRLFLSPTNPTKKGPVSAFRHLVPHTKSKTTP